MKNIVCVNDFKYIEGKPIAYWISKKKRELFKKEELLSMYADCCTGMQTGNNSKYIRYWFEVPFVNTQINNKNGKWYRYNCGGETKKWYGNYLNIVLWENNGQSIKNEKGSVIRNEKHFFEEGISWKRIAGNCFCFRVLPKDFIFDQAGDSMFVKNNKMNRCILGYINSTVASELFSVISPTLNLTAGNMNKLPIKIEKSISEKIEDIVNNCIDISKSDWDSREISWDYLRHPLYMKEEVKAMDKMLEEVYQKWQEECEERFSKLRFCEEKLNSIFINAYNLSDEVSPEVKDESITIKKANYEDDIKSLISYIVGLIMGRYSLSCDGLVYAGGKFDKSKYGDYVDEDGIVPIYSYIGINGGLVDEICKLIKIIYGEKYYQNNIDFIAKALGRKSDESAEETINRYLNDDFYNDHLKTYQKRPIYWMLSSGKQGAFKCLIYLHRYNKDTLGLINSKYFLPRTALYKAERERLEARFATGKLDAREKRNVENELNKVVKCEEELLEYGQVLDHLANQYIELDLDDGVKENYVKFQGVTLQVNGATIKKDLLVPFGLEKKK